MSLSALVQVVRDQTVVYRKGDVVTVDEQPGLTVTTIDAFPAADPTHTTVDLHYVTVGLAEGADQEVFLAALKEATADYGIAGVFVDMSLSALRGGPSYITLGGWLGDQTIALAFMALLELHGVGHVITPERMGITDQALAEEMAGRGAIYGSLNRDVLA